MTEHNIRRGLSWIACACLLSMVVSLAKAEDEPLAITVSVARSVQEGMAIPAQVSIRNVSAGNIGVPDEAVLWKQSLLRARPLLGVSLLESAKPKPLPASEHSEFGNMPLDKLIDLAPGKTVTYHFQLRQVFTFPDQEKGKYEVSFTWEAVTAKAAFSIEERSRKWKLVTTRELPFDISTFYGWEPRGATGKKASVDVFVSPEGDRQRVFARTTYPLDPGAILVLEQAASTENNIVVVSGKPIREVRRDPQGADRQKVHEVARQYVAFAWLESDRVMVATFGSIVFGPRMMREHAPAEMRDVPALSVLCSPKEIKDGVKSIVDVRAAADGLVEVKVTLKDGTPSILYLDAQGKAMAPPSTQPTSKKASDEPAIDESAD